MRILATFGTDMRIGVNADGQLVVGFAMPTNGPRQTWTECALSRQKSRLTAKQILAAQDNGGANNNAAA